MKYFAFNKNMGLTLNKSLGSRKELLKKQPVTNICRWCQKKIAAEIEPASLA